MKVAEITKMMLALLFTPYRNNAKGEAIWGLPQLYWGPPGVGKTAVIEGIFAQCGLPLKVLSPAEEGEQGFGVVAVPEEATAEQKKLLGTNLTLGNPPPAWILNVLNGGGVFTDELGSTPPALQAPCLALLHARRIGGYRLHRRVRIIGAANRAEDAAGGWDLAAALANRMGHWDWEQDIEAWCEYMTGSQAQVEATLDAEAEEKRVLDLWPDYYSKAVTLGTGFIRARPDLLNKKPQPGDPALAWPSSRSVDTAIRAYAGAMLHKLDERLMDAAVSGYVGAGWMQEFAQYRAHADLPEPKDVLDGTVKWAHNPRRLDMTAAVLGGCVSLVVSDSDAKRKKTRCSKLWTILGEVSKTGADLCVPPGKVLCSKENAWALLLPEARPVLSKIKPALQVMGLMK